MKIKSYGNFNFKNYANLYYGVIVETGKGKKFITQLDRLAKTWKAEDNKRPYLFDNIKQARDLNYCLLLNGYIANVVEFLSFNNNLKS